MYYWDPSGPNRKSCAKASWASGLSPEEPSLVTMTTSDTRSASGAFLVTDGFHSFSVGRCTSWAVPDFIRHGNIGRHASAETFVHNRTVQQTTGGRGHSLSGQRKGGSMFKVG